MNPHFLVWSLRFTVNGLSGFPPSKQMDIMARLCAHGDLTALVMSCSKAPLDAAHGRQVSLVIARHHGPQSDSLCLTQHSYTNIMQYKNIELITVTWLHQLFREYFPDVLGSCWCSFVRSSVLIRCNIQRKSNRSFLHTMVGWSLSCVQMWQHH